MVLLGTVKSPFDYVDPLKPTDLVDRKRELEEVGDHLVATRNCRLVAPRRYGKTSLLRAALERARDDGLVGVYVSFLGVLTLDGITERIELAYRAQLDSGLRQWFSGLMSTLRPTVRVGGGPIPATAELSPGSPTVALLELLALPRRLHDRHGLRCAIAFDEFQDVLRAGERADAVIRSEIEQHGQVAGYVYAGSHPGMMRELFADRRRAFFGQATPIDLPPLPADELAEHVGERFAAFDRDIGDALGPFLDMARGHPQRAMLLAHHLFVQTPRKTVADPATWLSALSGACQQVDAEIRATWDGLPTTARRALAVIADGGLKLNSGPAASRYGLQKSGGSRAAVRRLADEAHVYEDPTTPTGWRVVDPLLALWVRGGRAWPEFE